MDIVVSFLFIYLFNSNIFYYFFQPLFKRLELFCTIVYMSQISEIMRCILSSDLLTHLQPDTFYL